MKNCVRAGFWMSSSPVGRMASNPSIYTTTVSLLLVFLILTMAASAAEGDFDAFNNDCGTPEPASDCQSKGENGRNGSTRSAKYSLPATGNDDCDVDDCLTVVVPRFDCPVGAACMTGGSNLNLGEFVFYFESRSRGGGRAASPETAQGEPDSIDCWTGLTSNSRAAISSGYGQQPNRWHKGIDVQVVAGTHVRTARDGVVRATYDGDDVRTGSSTMGNYVLINYDGGESGRYLHLKQNSVRVRKGGRVAAGQMIAQSSETGLGTRGAHLHYDHNTGSIPPDEPNRKSFRGSGSFVNPEDVFAACD